jgi:hypothetical protein
MALVCHLSTLAASPPSNHLIFLAFSGFDPLFRRLELSLYYQDKLGAFADPHSSPDTPPARPSRVSAGKVESATASPTVIHPFPATHMARAPPSFATARPERLAWRGSWATPRSSPRSPAA